MALLLDDGKALPIQVNCSRAIFCISFQKRAILLLLLMRSEVLMCAIFILIFKPTILPELRLSLRRPAVLVPCSGTGAKSWPPCRASMILTQHHGRHQALQLCLPIVQALAATERISP